MKAVIPTGGRGTRMRPITFSENKHFILLAGKPLIFYPIETVAEVGIKEVAIVYNPGWLDLVKSVLGDGSKWGLSFTYVLQESPKGLPNIFQVCEKFVAGDKFLMHLGDNIFVDGIKEMVKFFEKKNIDGMVTKMKHPENWRLGVPVFDKDGKLTDYLEKPKNPPNEYAIPGLYFFDSVVFKCFDGKDAIQPSERGEYEIYGPYKWLMKHGYQVEVVDYTGKWLDPGKFDDWIPANQYLLDRNATLSVKSDLPKDVIISGRVIIGKDCKISNSEIRGPCIIGDGVAINNSFIGSYSSIGDACRIEGSSIENSILMKNCLVSCLPKMIDKSIISSDVEIVDSGNNYDKKLFIVGENSQITL